MRYKLIGGDSSFGCTGIQETLAISDNLGGIEETAQLKMKNFEIDWWYIYDTLQGAIIHSGRDSG